MKIHKPDVVADGKDLRYRVLVEFKGHKGTLWYSVDQAFGNLFADSSDAPLVGLLIPAMLSGEDIVLDGVISERLYYNVTRPLQRLLRHIIPSLRQISIHPSAVTRNSVSLPLGVATGFSAGIDSFCTLVDHLFTDVPQGFRITHLLYNNVGSHGGGSEGERVFRERYERLLPMAERLGLPFLRINSNLGNFYRDISSFEQTHTLRNASVALLLQGGVSRFMYSSAYDYPRCFVGPNSHFAFADPFVLPLLSTESLDVLSVGSEYTRVEKTLRVAELADASTILDVCVNDKNPSGYTNCSTCYKCLRTLATLDIAGRLNDFSASFDLDAYKARRKLYLAELLGSSDPLSKEIAEFAKEQNFSFPLLSRLINFLGASPAIRFSIRELRALKRLLADRSTPSPLPQGSTSGLRM